MRKIRLPGSGDLHPGLAMTISDTFVFVAFRSNLHCSIEPFLAFLSGCVPRDSLFSAIVVIFGPCAPGHDETRWPEPRSQHLDCADHPCDPPRHNRLFIMGGDEESLQYVIESLITKPDTYMMHS